MNLLITTDNFPPRWDGIGRFLTNVVPLLKDTFNITIIHPDYGEHNIEGVKQIKIPLSRLEFGDYKIPETNRKIIKKYVKETTLVFGQTIGPIGGLSAIYADKYNKTYIPYIHSVEWNLVKHASNNKLTGRLLKKITKLYGAYIYKKATEIYVPSKQIEEELYWNNIKRKTKIVRLGVDTKKFRPRKEQDETWLENKKEELGIAKKQIIGYHGRLAREKNLTTLLRAVKRLKNEDIVLLIIGDGMQSIRARLEREKNCVTLGSKKDIENYIRLFDIFVSPSLSETTSLSTVEALSTGIPVVATPAGYIPHYIEHGENGYTFPFKDSYTLSKILEMLLEHKDTQHRISEKGRKTATQKFSWEKTAEKLLHNLHEQHNT